MYGVGCRACTFTNAFGLGSLIDTSVDDQVERQGLFMPGSRIPIGPPQTLNGSTAPLVCLLAVNNENEAKVTERLREIVDGRQATIISVFAPADIWQGLSQIEAL